MKHMGKVVEYLKERVLYPVNNDLFFLLLIWVFLAVPEGMVQLVKGHFLYSGLYFIMFFGVAYLIVFLLNFSRRVAPFLKPAFFLLLVLFTAVDIYCLYRYHSRLNYNILDVMAGTNTAEVKEYLRMYVGWKEYTGYAIFILGAFLLYYAASYRFKSKINWSPWVIGLCLCCAVVAGAVNPALRNEFEVWNFNLDDVADLRKYPTNPALDFQTDSLPRNVVVIIGESHSPRHSSLYGYTLATNPLLEKLRDQSNLIVFDSVVSPATNTSRAFRYILNTKTVDSEDETPWYKSIHLLEVMNKAGYTTYWFSNQARSGLYNNLSSASADLADSAVFIRQLWEDKIYDGDLADIELKKSEGDKNMVVYHLMGQHVMFNERYPEEFNKFSAQDYPGIQGEEKKNNLAAYDNATLYNDYVIDKIISRYAGEDSVVIYLSDHGLDIYESTDDYAGHAIETPESQRLGKEVPFYIFVSDSFKQKRPELVKRIEESARKGFVTDRLIYTVMDLSGIKFQDNDYVVGNKTH